jgi:VanZ family protein
MLGLLFWLYFHLWKVKKPVLWGIIAAILVASYDEYTQSLSSFRSGRIEDVILDSCGIMITSWIVNVLKGKLLKRMPSLRFLTKID